MIAAFDKNRKPQIRPGLTRRDLEEVILPVALIGVYLVAAYAALRHAANVEDTIPDPTPRSIYVFERVIYVSPIQEGIDAAA